MSTIELSRLDVLWDLLTRVTVAEDEDGVVTASIRSPACFASAPGNINGPAVSATTPVARYRISVGYWPSSRNVGRTVTVRM